MDLSGTEVLDKSQLAYLAAAHSAGTTQTLPATTTDLLSRRAEIYYLLQHSRNQYAALSIPQGTTTSFTYYEDPTASCQSPGSALDCCGGSSRVGCIEIGCESDMGTSAPGSVERRFREVLFHEHNHTLRWMEAEPCATCLGTATTDGSECGCWEEGRADAAALIVGHFESTRPEFRPSLKYPNDYQGAGEHDYASAAIWTAIYAEYALKTSVAQSLVVINGGLGSVNTSTRLVGTCSNDSDFSTCPTNADYARLWSKDQTTYASGDHAGAELSESFHAHITDADRATSGTQSWFPWIDETPNHWRTPPFIAVEDTTSVTVSEGNASSSGALRFNYSTDRDTFMFMGRAGESYYVDTFDIAAGVDTWLEILDSSGSVVLSNDDCPGSGDWRSCLTFNPTSTGMYRARVYPYPGSQTADQDLQPPRHDVR